MALPDRQAFSSRCHLCKRVALWQCIDCDGGLCDQCKTVHLGNRTQRDHQVVYLRPSAIGERLQRRPAETTTSNKDDGLYCVDHPKDIAKLYCSTCNLPICDRCSAGKHRSHTIDDVSGLVDNKRQELSKLVSQSENKLTSLNASMKNLNKDQQERSNEIRELTEAVEYRGKEIKAETDRITNNIIKQLQQVDNKNFQLKKRTEQSIAMELEELQAFRDNYAREYKSRGAGNVVVKLADDAKEDMKAQQGSHSHQAFSRPRFVPGSRDPADLMKVIGSLVIEEEGKESNGYDSSDSDFSSSFNTSIASSFTPLTNAGNVAVLNERQAWIGPSGNGKELSLVTNNGHVHERVNLDFHLYDIALTVSGDLLVVAFRGYHILKLKPSGKLDTLKDTMPFQPQGICVTPDNEILVCLVKPDDKEAKVDRLIETGPTKQSIQYDKDRRQIFTNPQLVRQNINEDICVIDKCTDARNTQRCNTLVVVDRGGRLAFKYTKPKNSSVKSEFDFKGIACDKYGHILLSDVSNSCIHLLNKNGKFLQFVLAARHGIKCPLGIDIDKTGKLWVCDETGRSVKVFRYLSD